MHRRKVYCSFPMASEELEHFDLEALIAATIAGRICKHKEILPQGRRLSVKKRQWLVVCSPQDSVVAGVDHKRRNVTRKGNASIGDSDQVTIVTAKKPDP